MKTDKKFITSRNKQQPTAEKIKIVVLKPLSKEQKSYRKKARTKLVSERSANQKCRKAECAAKNVVHKATTPKIR